MRFIALISGGKDSLFTIHKLRQQNHTLMGLLYMHDTSSSIDSYMFQSVGHELIDCFSTCLNVPLYKFNTSSRSINTTLTYSPTEDDEVEDLHRALSTLCSQLQFDAVSSGAILSRYQKNRVDTVCSRLGLGSLAPLWDLDQESLLDEMIKEGVEAVIVKVAVPGLDKSTIGLGLSSVRDRMGKVKWPNYCGEGGEYESVVTYMPGFSKRIEIRAYEVCMHPEEVAKEWNVWYMRIVEHEMIEV